MQNIAANIIRIRGQICVAARKYGRTADAVTLVAVSKAQPADRVRLAVSAGQRDFGENYLQEAILKIKELDREGLIWHFIGPVQSNKTRQVAEHFDWVHTLDRERVARRLSEARSPGVAPLNVCIQVNIRGEASKSGVAPAHVADFAEYVRTLPGLGLRGLMVIPAPSDDYSEQRKVFQRTAALMKKLNESGHNLDTLSMGMSGDFEAAVAEGSTLVRIGAAIFGPRRT